jgi:adenosine kinase
MNILLTGSVAYDYLMTFPGYFRDHILPDRLDAISLSFLVDSMVRLRGGVAPNIAYTLALLGGRPKLWAAVGEDFDEYRLWLQSKGVDVSGARVIPGVYTASFFVSTDQSNAQIATFYPGAMGYAAQLSIKELSSSPPDLVVISPNAPDAMNLYTRECQELGIPYIYDPSQQIVRLTADEVRCGIEGALALFVNDYEFALVEKMIGLTAAELLANRPDRFIVVTRGAKGATVESHTGLIEVAAVEPERIVDPTGVGDAFRGGFLTGYYLGLSLLTCARMGSLAAAYCLEQRGPQGHTYTRVDFMERYRRLFDDGDQLESAFKTHNGSYDGTV